MDIINFSGGRSSAFMTKKLIEQDAKKYTIIFQNTGREHEKTLEFINNCSLNWNVNIIWLEFDDRKKFKIVDFKTASRNGEPFEKLIELKKGMLPNMFRRFCTDYLKIQVCKNYLKSLGIENWTIYNGIRYDEPHRYNKAKNYYPSYIDVLMPLVDWKITKNDVLSFWKNQKFDLELPEYLGNCDGCFLKGITKIKKFAKYYPEKYQWWIDQENKSKKINEKMNMFRTDLTYQVIKNVQDAQLNLFENEQDFSCLCNID